MVTLPLLMVVVKLSAFGKKKPWAFRFSVRQWFKILCPFLKVLHQGLCADGLKKTRM